MQQDNNIAATQAANQAYFNANPNVFGIAAASAGTNTVGGGTSGGGATNNSQPDGQLKTDASGNVIQYAAAPQGATTNSQTLTPAQIAFNKVNSTNAPAPQDAGAAKQAVTAATDQVSASPTFYKPTTPVAGYDPQTVFNAKGEALSAEDYKAQSSVGDFSDIQAGSPPPRTTPDNSTPNVDNFFNNNESIAQQTQALEDYLNPQSVTDQLNQELTKINTDNATLAGLNTQYMNIQNVMSGTETDIRTEIQAAGGMATNSQVMALSAARNKVLLQQAKTIQESVSNQKNIIANDTKLYADEKAIAQQQYTERSGVLKMVLANQTATQKANTSTYSAIVKNMGYAGLYASLQNDPTSLSNAEKSLGLQPGQLESLAKGQPLKGGEKISTYETEGGKTYKVTTQNGKEISRVEQKPLKGKSGSGGKFNPDKPAQNDINSMEADLVATATGSDKALSPDDWSQALKQWTGKGYSQKSFVSNFKEFAKRSAYFPLRDYEGIQ